MSRAPARARRSVEAEILCGAIGVGSLSGSAIRFFRPLGSFLSWAREEAGGRVVYDVGAGTGHVSLALSAEGVRVLAIDLGPSPASVWQTVSADGGAFAYRPGSVVMLCRPCHGSFPERVVSRAVERGASVWYVGLERNVADDLDVSRFEVKLFGAGEDGENVWVMEAKGER